MAIRQYIGARYVPYFYLNSDGNNEWRAGVEYEPLTVVTYNGNSYTSRNRVPSNIGNPSDNSAYWVITGNFNAQLNNILTWKDTVDGQIDALVSGMQNAVYLGCKNDGSEDCSAILNAATANGPIYFPAGIYRLDAPLVLLNSIVGDFSTRMHEHGGTVLRGTFGGDSAVVMITSGNDEHPITVKDLSIDGSDEYVCGFRYIPTSRVPTKLENVTIFGCRDGIDISPVSSTSRAVFITNVSLYGAMRADMAGSVGVYTNNYAHDVMIEGAAIMYFNIGIESHAFLRVSDIHVYTPNKYILTETDAATLATYFASSMCMNVYEPIIGDNLYLDTALQLFVQRKGKSVIGSMIAQYDSVYNSTGNTSGTGIRGADDTCSIEIGSLVYGGDLTTVNLMMSDVVRVGVMGINYDIAYFDTSKHGRMVAKGIIVNGSTARYKYTSTQEYKELARIKAAGSGSAKIAICAGSAKVVLQIRITGIGNCSIVKESGATFDWPLYYKWDGVTIVILGYHAAGAIRSTANLLDFGAEGDNVGLIDPYMYRMYTMVEQADATGLTLIS